MSVDNLADNVRCRNIRVDIGGHKIQQHQLHISCIKATYCGLEEMTGYVMSPLYAEFPFFGEYRLIVMG